MALKRKINQATFDKLSDELKKEYKKGSSDDEFILDTEGDEDTGALKRAKDREKQRADDLEKERDDLKKKVEETENGDARKKGDIETLEKSWKKKLEDKEAELNGKLSKRDGMIQKTLVDNVASGLAHKISNAPGLLLPHVKARITVDWEGDEPKTRILDKDGKPSAMSVEDLEKEFSSNKDFSAIIIASKASGGARSAPTGNGGGAPANGNQSITADLSKMTPQQLAASLKDSKANES